MGPSSAGSRAQSAWLFRKTIADPHTRSLDSCSKSSSLEAARPGQAGSCPGGADRTAWRSGRDLEPVCRVPPSPARGRGGGGGGDRLGSSPHSAQRFAGAGPWPELWEPRFPGRAAAGPHLLAARDEAPGPTRTDGAGTGTGGRAAARRGGHSADGGSRRAAVGTSPLPAERTAPGAARGGAKEKVSPGPGQPRPPGHWSPWGSRVPGTACAGGSERGQARQGGG